MTSRRTSRVAAVPRSKLVVAALLCLFTFALVAAAVAHGRGPYGFEDPTFRLLGAPSTVGAWDNVAEFLAAPAIGTALVLSVAFGIARGALFRIAAYAALAATALIISQYVAKPLVDRSYYGEPTFPSGNVTAVSATALALWLALYPLVGKRARRVLLVIGACWTLLMSCAVVGALWHTPVDAFGSMLLSVGVVTAGAAGVEHASSRARHSGGSGRPMVRQRG